MDEEGGATVREELYVLRVRAEAAFADIVLAAFETLGYAAACWDAEDAASALVEAYFERRADAVAAEGAVAALLSGQDAWTVSVERLAHRDWRDAWKSFFHTIRVSPRIVVKPSWEHAAPPPGVSVVELDPGLSFGTGHHPTTQACLRFVDAVLVRNEVATMADLGCGSGIVSIAAAKLGVGRIDAVDIDADAVDAARRNCAVNGVEDQVVVRQTDAAAAAQRGPYDLVCANILAPVLRQHLAAIAGMPAGGGHLILAGILSSEYGALRDAYREAGLEEADRESGEEWTSGLFRKPYAGFSGT